MLLFFSTWDRMPHSICRLCQPMWMSSHCQLLFLNLNHPLKYSLFSSSVEIMQTSSSVETNELSSSVEQILHRTSVETFVAWVIRWASLYLDHSLSSSFIRWADWLHLYKITRHNSIYILAPLFCISHQIVNMTNKLLPLIPCKFIYRTKNVLLKLTLSISYSFNG